MWNLCYKSKILESMRNWLPEKYYSNLTLQFWNPKVKFERAFQSPRVAAINFFFSFHGIVLLNN